MKIFIYISIFLFSVSIFPEKPEDYVVLLSQGNIAEASKMITQLYTANPSLPINQMAYARIMTDGVEAKKLYSKIVLNSLSSDSLKAEALYQLGCFYYSKKEYIKADSLFSEAQKKNNLEKILHMSALSSLNKKNSITPQSISGITNDIQYTLQVGAFSTLVNAKKMFLTMEKTYDNVSIKKDTVKGTVYHKVRVKTFSTIDEARNYGELYLKKKNIQFTVVVH